MKDRLAVFGPRLLAAACVVAVGGVSTIAHATVTPAVCNSAKNKANRVYAAALKNTRLYPTAAAARAAANAAFTRQIMAEDARPGTEYTGTGRAAGEFAYAQALCRRFRVIYP